MTAAGCGSPIEDFDVRLDNISEPFEERFVNFLDNSSVLYKLSTAAIATYVGHSIYKIINFNRKLSTEAILYIRINFVAQQSNG